MNWNIALDEEGERFLCHKSRHAANTKTVIELKIIAKVRERER